MLTNPVGVDLLSASLTHMRKQKKDAVDFSEVRIAVGMKIGVTYCWFGHEQLQDGPSA